jgi:hypothetical protein
VIVASSTLVKGIFVSKKDSNHSRLHCWTGCASETNFIALLFQKNIAVSRIQGQPRVFKYRRFVFFVSIFVAVWNTHLALGKSSFLTLAHDRHASHGVNVPKRFPLQAIWISATKLEWPNPRDKTNLRPPSKFLARKLGDGCIPCEMPNNNVVYHTQEDIMFVRCSTNHTHAALEIVVQGNATIVVVVSVFGAVEVAVVVVRLSSCCVSFK